MKLIVGLGNPGVEYENTRHNIGFKCVDAYSFARTGKSEFSLNKKLYSSVLKIDNTILAKPQTYMNESGKAVAALATYFKISGEDIYILHDEVDLEFSKIKIQKGGGSAGHNGVKSIIQSLGTDEFIRWRIGIGKPPKEYGIDTADFVLGNFSRTEEDMLGSVIENVVKSLDHASTHDLVATMNQYN